MQHFSVSSEHWARSDLCEILGLSRNEPGAIGWDARMLPLCYAINLHLKKHSLGKNLFEAFKSKFWKNAVGLKFQLQLNDVVKIDSWLKYFWSFFDFFFLDFFSWLRSIFLQQLWQRSGGGPLGLGSSTGSPLWGPRPLEALTMFILKESNLI